MLTSLFSEALLGLRFLRQRLLLVVSDAIGVRQREYDDSRGQGCLNIVARVRLVAVLQAHTLSLSLQEICHEVYDIVRSAPFAGVDTTHDEHAWIVANDRAVKRGILVGMLRRSEELNRVVDVRETLDTLEIPVIYPQAYRAHIPVVESVAFADGHAIAGLAFGELLSANRRPVKSVFSLGFELRV